MSQLGRPTKPPSTRITKKHAQHIEQLIERNDLLVKNNMRLKALLKEKGFDQPDSIEGDIYL